MDTDLTKTVELNPSSPNGLPPSESASIPESIGPYKIHSLLKRGGMSLVFLAARPNTGETVVVKIVLPKYLKSKEMLSRLLREAKILHLTTHPSIVKLYDLGRGEQGLYVVMEYIQGVSLRQFLKTQALTHRRALEIVLQIAYALAHLHSHGIIHRDLKPDNVLITESGDVKLIDFGISQFIETEDIDDKTESQGKIGTPAYMSPEQKEKPFKLSYTTDIFSLAIIAYELYLGHSAHGVVQIAVLPKALQKILGKALAIDPLKRYPDIIDFIADLSEYMKNMEQSGSEESGEEAYESVAAFYDLLLPKKAPEWPEVEAGMKILKGPTARACYLDFFRFSPVHFGLIFARPEGLERAPEELSLTAMLCGMSRALVEQKEFQISPFLANLHRCLSKEVRGFSLACLSLNLEKNQLSFASCGCGSLWHFPVDGVAERRLEADNPSWASRNREDEFVAIKENWNSGDWIFFSTFEIEPSALSQKTLLSAQSLVDTAMGALAPRQEASALIAMKRL